MSTETKNSGRGGLRGWHAWLSVVLAVPIVIVSLTAIFIAHDKSLGLKEIPLGRWAPTEMEGMEVRALFTTGGGTDYVGTKYGLMMREGANLTPIAALDGIEVRGMAEAGDALYAATKAGLWRLQGGTWERVLAMETWSASTGADGVLRVAVKDSGIMATRDGGASWTRDAAISGELDRIASAMPPRPLSLGELVMHLHTGKAFFGKHYEWIWIDVVGAVMTFLTLSGVIIWWRARRQKLKATMAVLEARESPAHR